MRPCNPRSCLTEGELHNKNQALFKRPYYKHRSKAKNVKPFHSERVSLHKLNFLKQGDNKYTINQHLGGGSVVERLPRKLEIMDRFPVGTDLGR